MTPRQKQCLDYIQRYWDEHGYAPSYNDIREALSAKSKSSVAALIEQLVQRGYVTRTPHLARSIQVVQRSRTVHNGSSPYGASS